MTNVRRVLVPEDSDVYHGLRRGRRVKCGGVSRRDGEVVRVEEFDPDGRRPCGNCWRSKPLRRGVVEEVEST